MYETQLLNEKFWFRNSRFTAVTIIYDNDCIVPALLRTRPTEAFHDIT